MEQRKFFKYIEYLCGNFEDLSSDLKSKNIFWLGEINLIVKTSSKKVQKQTEKYK